MSFTITENTTQCFSNGTLSGTIAYDDSLVLGSTEQYINGILVGMWRTDIIFYANRFNGGSNAGEVDITGTYFIDHFGNNRTLRTIGYGLGLQDSSSVNGYIMYSVQNTYDRFSPHANCSHDFVGVWYNSGQWYYDNNTSWVPFTTTSGDCLVASLTWGVSNLTRLSCRNSYGDRSNYLVVSGTGPVVAGGTSISYEHYDGLFFDGSSYVSIGNGWWRNDTHTIEIFGFFTAGLRLFCRGAAGESVATNIVQYSLTSSTMSIFIESGSSGTDYSYSISLSKNYLDGNKHHISVVRYGVRLIAYIDCVYEGEVTTIITDSTAPIYIGYNGTTGYLSDATLTEVRVWNISRTLQDIIATSSIVLNGDEDGLAAYYMCNRVSGGVLTDLSVNGRNGTVVGGSVVRVVISVRSSTDYGGSWSEWRTIEKNSRYVDHNYYGKPNVLIEYKQEFSCNMPLVTEPVLSNFSIDVEYAYRFSGLVYEESIPVTESGVKLMLYDRISGNVVDSSYVTDGTFELIAPAEGYYYVVALHNAEEEYNGLIYDWLGAFPY